MKIQWKQVIATLLIGLSLGYFAGMYNPTGRPMFKRMSPEKKLNWMMKRLSSKLNLTDDQKVRVEAILASSRKQMMALHDGERPKFDAVRNQTNEAIRKVLTPEQQPVFDKLQAEWQARRDKRRK